MIAHFGADRRLDRINDRDVAAWIAARRGERVWGKIKFKDGRDAPLISPARVNRSTVDILRATYARARRVWKIAIATEPDWRQHRLKEPEERARELETDEQASIDAAAREGYGRLYRFARLSGLRLSACLLRKDDVKWSLGRVEVRSKGGKLNRVPLSAEIRALLLECWQDRPEFVFTYVAKRTDGEEHQRGKRYPITASGLHSQWKRDRTRSSREPQSRNKKAQNPEIGADFPEVVPKSVPQAFTSIPLRVGRFVDIDRVDRRQFPWRRMMSFCRRCLTILFILGLATATANRADARYYLILEESDGFVITDDGGNEIEGAVFANYVDAQDAVRQLEAEDAEAEAEERDKRHP
jgi:hypothetical protein